MGPDLNLAPDAAKAKKDAIYAQFESGMRGFVERSRQNHIVPSITLCYTRNDFASVEYEYTRRMNLAINAWDVPSVNFLGAVDDRTGKWAKGFWHDSLHQNAAGHDELLRTFVPTDGKLAGAVMERLEPRQFTLTGPHADYRDLLIYRSALNADEVAALESGRLLQASLEVYSPLTELGLQSKGMAANLAQSLTTAKLGSASVEHMDR